MQQLCGLNAIAYYSSNIFKQANFNDIQALLATFGVGLSTLQFGPCSCKGTNVKCSQLAVCSPRSVYHRHVRQTQSLTCNLSSHGYIPVNDRLWLVSSNFHKLTTYLTPINSFIPEDSQARLGVIATGIYLFTMVYSRKSYPQRPQSPIPNHQSPLHHFILTFVIYATTAGSGPVPFTYSAPKPSHSTSATLA
jgi:hypothetical protein